MADTSLSACLAEIKANPGKFYVYMLSRPCGTPFYVGVGSKWRITHHEYEAIKRRARTHKAAIIRKLIAGGERVAYLIVGWFDTWSEGAEVERLLIAQHGRRDIGTGILVNRTDGGEGVPNLKWEMTEARATGIARASEKARGRKLSEDHKAKIAAAGIGRKKSAETLALMSRLLTGRSYSDETLQRMSKGQRKRAAEGRMDVTAMRSWVGANIDQVAETQRNKWKDPEYRKRQTAALRAAKRDESHRRDPEYRAKLSAAAKARWANPEFAARVTAAIRAAKRQA